MNADIKKGMIINACLNVLNNERQNVLKLQLGKLEKLPSVFDSAEWKELEATFDATIKR